MGRGRRRKGEGPSTSPGEWADQAGCHNQPHEFFYPEEDENNPAVWIVGKSICDRCEVSQQCLEYALTIGEKHGLWGGLTPKERRKVKRQRERLRRQVWISQTQSKPALRSVPPA